MGHPRWELANRETGIGIYRRRWDIQGGNWQAGRWEEEFTARDGTSKAGTARYGDGKRNLPLEMGHPRPELPGTEMGRGIYHRRWDIQDGNWQIGRWEEEFTTGDGTSKMRRWDIQDGNWQAELGELAARETGRGIYRRQVGRWEEEFTAWHGTSKAGMGLPRPELAGREETCTTAGGNWQVGRWEKNLPQKMWNPRLQLAGREIGRGI